MGPPLPIVPLTLRVNAGTPHEPVELIAPESPERGAGRTPPITAVLLTQADAATRLPTHTGAQIVPRRNLK